MILGVDGALVLAVCAASAAAVLLRSLSADRFSDLVAGRVPATSSRDRLVP